MNTAEIAIEANLTEEAKAMVRADLGPSRFVDLLESQGLFRDAIQFLTHGLPINLAIKWGCMCSTELIPADQMQKCKASFDAANTWLKSPSDKTRWEARNAAERSNISSPTDLIAMAAFFSGGSITPSDTPDTPPPPHVASALAAAGIQMAVLSQFPEKSGDRYRRSLEISRKIVNAERK